jgi:LysM repeat protein
MTDVTDRGTLTVVRDAVNGRSFTAPDGYRMYIYSETGRLKLSIPLAPREIEYGGLANDWSEADRSGTTPLLLLKSTPLLTMSFSFTLTDKYDMQASQTSQVQALKDVARTLERVFVRYSGTEQGLWRVTEVSLSSVLRTEDTNEIARATVSITLTQASDPAPAVGPVSKPAPPAPPKPVARTYVVVRGDCLWNIALRFYKNGSLWPKIFDANRKLIKDPHWIYPGQRFTIP